MKERKKEKWRGSRNFDLNPTYEAILSKLRKETLRIDGSYMNC